MTTSMVRSPTQMAPHRWLVYLALLVTLLAQLALASHFRYATWSWSRSAADPLFVTFRAEEGWRYQAAWISGSTINYADVAILWDSTTTTKSGQILQLSAQSGTTTNDYILGYQTWTYRYSAPKAYLAGISSSARISTLVDGNANANYIVWAGVNLTSNTYASPKAYGVPILTFYWGINNTWQIPIDSPAPYRVIAPTTAQSGLTNVQPKNMTLSTGGLISWNPQGALGLYAFQARVQLVNDSSTYVPVDMIFNIIIPAISRPPTPPAFGNSTVAITNNYILVTVGTWINFTVNAVAAFPNRTATVDANVLPTGATWGDCIEGLSVTPMSRNQSCTRQFSWQPTSLGLTYLIFTSRDSTLVGTLSTLITVKVVPQPPVITSVSPSGNTAGGTLVTVTGTNFDSTDLNSQSIQINGQNCTNPTLTSATTITCIAPAGQGGVVGVQGEFNGFYGPVYTGWGYIAPSITSISPSSGGTVGGYNMTITGTNFGTYDEYVSIGGVNQTILSSTPTQIIVQVQPGSGASLPVTVGVTGQTNSASNQASYLFTYNAPTLSTATGSPAPTAGGGNITITGTNFGPPGSPMTITVGGVTCTNVSHTQTTAYCLSPPGVGSNAVAMTVNGQPATGSATYTYGSPTFGGAGTGASSPSSTAPTGTTGTPALFMTAGGEQLVIRGSNFGVTQPSSSSVGGVWLDAVSSGTYLTIVSWNDSTIVATYPAGQGATHPVYVVAGGQTSPALPTGYIPPVITSVTPQDQANAGGTSIAIQGTNLGGTGGNGEGSVMIGGVNCPMTTHTATLIVCVLPAGQGANNSVVVTTGAQPSNVLPYNYAVPVITGVSPSNPSTAGTLMTLTGTNFGTTGQVYVDDVLVTTTLYSDGTIRFNLPAGTGVNHPIMIRRNGQNSTIAYFDYAAPVISDVSPTTVTGGGSTTITGSNFGTTGLTTVTMQTSNGGPLITLPITSQSQTQLIVTIPVGNGTSLPLTVNVNSQVSNTGYFSYQNPTLASITVPAGAGTAGGAQVTIVGTSFDTSGTVTVAGKTCAIVSWSQSQVVCTLPAGQGADQPLVLTTVAGKSVTDTTSLDYTPPAVSGLSPSTSAPSQGGTYLTLTGTNFGSGGNVTIGGYPCNITSYNQTQIVCIVPPLVNPTTAAVGFGPVILNVAGQTSSPITLLVSGPTVNSDGTGLQPANGPTNGGTVITINGSSFGPANQTVTVALGSGSCTVVSHTQTQIFCVTPVGVGTQSVRVTVLGSTSPSIPFTYDPPVVTSISPNSSLAAAGGTVITINGTSFSTTGQVYVGTQLCTPVISYTQNSIICTSPYVPGANVPVTVVVNGVTSTGPNGGTSPTVSAASPVLSGGSPAVGDVGGGYSLTFTGTNFGVSGSVTVGGLPCSPISSYTTTQIICSAPTTGVGHDLLVVVTSNGLSSNMTGAGLFSYTRPRLTSINPQFQTTAGQFGVTLVGTNLGPSGSGGVVNIYDYQIIQGIGRRLLNYGVTPLQCNTVFTGDYQNQVVYCTMPAGQGTVNVSITVGDQTTNEVTYTYASPDISTTSPSTTPTVGGQVLTIQGSNFGSRGNVTIGGLPCNITSYSQTYITCIIPAGVGTNQSVVLKVSGQVDGDGMSLSYNAPTLTAISPANAPSAGGTQITLTGTNFGPSTALVTVTIGGVTATVVSHDDASAIVTLPAGKGTNLAVQLTVGGQSTNTKPFAYDAPTVTRVAGCSEDTSTAAAGCPITGYAGQGTILTVYGSNFGSSGDASVTVGGNACPSVTLFSGYLTCQLPAGLSYNQPVYVSVGGQTNSPAGLVSYVVPVINPQTLRLNTTPRPGGILTVNTISGGQTIVLEGKNFKPSSTNPTVYFGPATNPTLYQCTVTTANSTYIECTLPAGVGGNFTFEVYDGAQYSAPSQDQLFYPRPAIVADTIQNTVQNIPGTHLSGSKSQGETIQFHATNVGNDASKVTVYYGPTGGPYSLACANSPPPAIVLSNYNSSTTDVVVTCQTSAGSGNDYHFIITANGYSSQEGIDTYSYPTAPVITGVSGCTDVGSGNTTSTINCPTSAVNASGQAVILTLRGSGFSAADLYFTVGGTICPLASTPTDTYATCYLQPGSGKSVSVLGIAGGALTSQPAYLVSFKAPAVTNITGCELNQAPWTQQCNRTGGEVITIRGSNFGTSGALVLICGQSCTNVTHSTTTPNDVITCITPPGVSLDQGVTVVQSGQISVPGGEMSYRQCQAGTYQASQTDYNCTSCTAGTYSDTAAAAFCKQCPSGTYVGYSGAAACIPASTGSYATQTNGVGASTQTACAAGTASGVTSQASCTSCNPGSYASTTGLTACVSCGVGTASSAVGTVTCTNCTNGYYARSTGTVTCSPCLQGTYAVNGASVCTSCAAGTYQSSATASTCVACGLGTAVSVSGQDSCPQCASGTFANTTGLQTCYTAPAGFIAAQSSGSGAQSPVACAAGTYMPSSGQSVCLSCAAGTYMADTGATACIKCSAGTYISTTGGTACTNATTGTYIGTDGASSPTSCDVGTYAPVTGLTVCIKCSTGTYIGSTGQSACLSADLGTIVPTQGASQETQCPVGYYAPSTGLSVCTACSPGYYTGAAGSSAPTPCDAGTYTESSGQSFCKSCPAGSIAATTGLSTCTQCPAGTLAATSGLSSCTNASAGYYTPSAGASVPIASPAGSYIPLSGATQPTPVPAGHVQPSTGQTSYTACNPGSYMPLTGQSVCLTAPAGFFTNQSGAITTLPAGPGHYQPNSGQTSGIACAIGYATSASGQVACTACGVGTYANTTGALYCTECELGRYTAASASTLCYDCAVGYYADSVGQYVCKAAALGYVQPYAGQSSQMACPAGQYSPLTNQATCLACDNGYYSTSSGQASCTPCSVGTSNSGTGNTNCSSCPAGTMNSGGSGCTSCPAGTYSAAGSVGCTSCPVGTFSNSSVGTGACTNCPVGSYAASAGATVCTFCGAGTANIVPGSASCSACVDGTYSSTIGASSCITCPAGYSCYSGGSSTQGASAPTLCAAGTYASGEGQAQCTQCAVGFYNPGNSSLACIACGPGTLAAATGASVCASCVIGRFSSGSATVDCTLATVGTYVQYTGQSLATGCPAGQYQSGTGATRCEQCIAGTYTPAVGQAACTRCSIGYYAPSAGAVNCLACGVGEFQSSEGAVSCSPCSLGQASDATGQAVCTECDSGTFANATGLATCFKCPAGSFSVKAMLDTDDNTDTSLHGASTCTQCTPGQYIGASGQGACLDCPVGRFMSHFGATICDAAQAGYYQDEQGQTTQKICPMGTYSAGGASIVCTPCDAGTYSNTTGSALACTPCPSTTYQPLQGQQSCLLTPAGQYTPVKGQATPLFCARGYYQPNNGSQACIQCRAGTFQASIGGSSCDPCAAGTFSQQAGAEVCVACAPGTYNNETGSTQGCIDCDLGYAQASNGATACVACTAGKVAAATGLPECTLCIEGYYTDINGTTQCSACPEGTFQNSQGKSSCRSCATGRYNPSTGQADCIDCKAGDYANDTGSLVCMQCPIGLYQQQKGASYCDACGVGYSSAQPGQSACLPCDAGYFSNVTASLGCSSCAAGTSQPDIGHSSCIDCSQGRYAPTSSQANCLTCGAGTYQPATGSQSCEACPAGTYNTLEAQTVCTQCGPGYYSGSGQKLCSACELGTVTSVNGTVACSVCLANSAPNFFRTYCDCDAGYFRYDSPDLTHVTCYSCPDGADCSSTGNTFTTLAAEVGFWRGSNTSTTFYRCLRRDQCAGGAAVNGGSSPCTGNRAGTLCAHCAAGYRAGAGNECVACPTGGASWFLLIFLALVVLFLVWLQLFLILYAARDLISKAMTELVRKDVLAHQHDDLLIGPGSPEAHGQGRRLSHASQLRSNGKQLGPWVTPAQAGRNISGGETTTTTTTTLISSAKGTSSGNGKTTTTTTFVVQPGQEIKLQEGQTINRQQIMVEEDGSDDEGVAATTSGGTTTLLPGTITATTSTSATVTLPPPSGLPPPAPLPPPPVPPTAPAPPTPSGGSGATVAPLRNPRIIELSSAMPGSPMNVGHGRTISKPNNTTGETPRPGTAHGAAIHDDAQFHLDDDDIEEEEEDFDQVEEALHIVPDPVPNFTYKIKIFLGFIQIVTNLGTGLEIQWPSTYKAFVALFDVFNFDWLLSSVLSTDCISSINYYFKYVVIVLIPIVLIILCFLYLLPRFLACCCYKYDTPVERRLTVLRFWVLVLYCLFLIYPAVSSTVLRHYKCKDIDDEWYVLADLRVSCYTDTWYIFAWLGIPLIALYPLGIPLFFFYQLYSNRDMLLTPGVRAKLGFLYDGYKKQLWWFEMVDMAHKLLMTSILAFFPTVSQLPIGMCICVIYAMIILWLQPYVRNEDDALHLLVQAEIFLLCAVGWVFYNLSVDAYSDTNDVAISAVLIILSIVVVLLFLALIGYVFKRRYERKKDLEAKAKAEQEHQAKRDALIAKKASMANLHQLGSGSDGESKEGLASKKKQPVSEDPRDRMTPERASPPARNLRWTPNTQRRNMKAMENQRPSQRQGGSPLPPLRGVRQPNKPPGPSSRAPLPITPVDSPSSMAQVVPS